MSRSRTQGDVETRITIRFTALVVAVLVLGIAVFVVVDTVAAGMRLDATLARRADRLAFQASNTPADPRVLEEARIVTSEGVVSSGEQFGDIAAIGPLDGFGYLDSPQGHLRVLAVPLGEGRSLQVVDAARLDVIDMLEKVAVLLAIALLVGGITYMLGLGFSRRALAPVRESMARLERFSADAGHELRTPLASVRASLDVAERTGDWQGAISRARIELENASVLVDRLLELTRLDPTTLRVERVQLARLMARIAEMCAPMAEKRGIAISVTGTDATVMADPILLERLVTNLVSNAIRFGDAGSKVTIRFDDKTIEVHNTCEPISSSELERVFEPFYRADGSRTGEGAGLGLAIAAAIVQAHGWSIRTASTKERGTTFSVVMRVAKDAIRS
jgi:signal transduction histidine kinase